MTTSAVCPTIDHVIVTGGAWRRRVGEAVLQRDNGPAAPWALRLLLRKPSDVGTEHRADDDEADLDCGGAQRSEAARAGWFDDEVRRPVERDALSLLQVSQRQSLADLLIYIAAQTGHLLNIRKAAESVGVERKTA